MTNEEETTDIQRNASPENSQNFESFIFDSLIRIKYQKKIFLDDILNEKTEKTEKTNADTNANICVTKRFFPAQNKENSDPILITAKTETTADTYAKSQNFCTSIEVQPPNPINFSENDYIFNKTVSFYPQCCVDIAPKKICKVYDWLFKITGAHLTQSEIIFLRKTIFRKVLPPIKRDEVRSKKSNIMCLEKHSEKVMAILSNPAVQMTIRNYVFSRRRKFEKGNMIYNFQKIITKKPTNI